MVNISRQFIILVLGVLLWIVACTPQSASNQPLIIGTGIYPGNAGHYIAAEKQLFDPPVLRGIVASILRHRLDNHWHE
jgi:hypothetical protein